jgi:hypothetical protein
MMCSINIDELQYTCSRICVPFSEMLDRLLDRLDNQHIMHGLQHDALQCVRGKRNDAHCYSTVTLHGL